jgi:nucleotide-binding universal stress UspA family protein
MNPFPSILVPLDGSLNAARSLGCATWLATRLQIRLHVLSASEDPLPVRAELERLHVPEASWPLISLHQAPAYPQDAILAAIARHQARLVILSAHGQTSDEAVDDPSPRALIGSVARAILEQSPVSVLLLPPAYREQLPWRRVLVPVTGGSATNEALAQGIDLANALDLEVHVAHVANNVGGEGLASRARYADTLHHEYQGRLEELITRAIPHCPAGAAQCIADLALCRGDIVEELLRLIKERDISLLVAGWHGRLTTGRAQVLKQLIQAVTCPVLLVKPGRRIQFRLKVGDALE